MKLILVRHGRTIQNEQGILQGQGRGDLSEIGVEQISKVAERLKDEKIDVAYSSDQERAVKTAQGILKFHSGVKLVQLPVLREISYGELEGQKKQKRVDLADEQHAKNQHFKAPGGESILDVQKRVVVWFHTLYEKHKDQTVLVVSHGTTIASLILHLLDKDHFEYRQHIPDNTGVTLVEVDEEQQHNVVLLNCTDHLG